MSRRAPAPRRSERLAELGAELGGERGSGVLSTVFGVTVFLVMLMFSAHLLLGLWLRSTVDAVAHDAATDVAESGTLAGDRSEAEARAIDRARDALGRYATQVDLDFEPSPNGEVVLHVRAPGFTLVPRAVADLAGIGGFDRRIVVHAESAESADLAAPPR